MKGQYKTRRAKKGGKSFNPNHQQVEQALLEFQQRGGTINRVDASGGNLNQVVQRSEERAVDEFLNDPGYAVRY